MYVLECPYFTATQCNFNKILQKPQTMNYTLYICNMYICIKYIPLVGRPVATLVGSAHLLFATAL